MKPNTPLPWAANEMPEKAEDVAFAIHAANAYPMLLEALGVALELVDGDPAQAKWSARWRELLAHLGEEVPDEI